jgi:hypothetical protein
MAETMDPKPEPIDLSHHLTAMTRNREVGNMKRFYKYFIIPDIQNIAGGESHPHACVSPQQMA